MTDAMDVVRCYLCDHEFVEGEEPWLMFEQRLREDGQIECSLADLLSSILEKDLQEAVAHSTLLCDSCNADVLEYESIEKRFLQIRERILNSYKENATIQNLHTLVQQTSDTPEESLPVSGHEVNKFLAEDPTDMDSAEFASITEMDLVEEIPDDEAVAAEEDKNDLNVTAVQQEDPDPGPCRFTEDIDPAIISENLDFAAFNEHVAQNSLPTGVLNLSDSLVNLEVTEKLPLESQGFIIYDVNQDEFQPADLIAKQENENSNLKSYDSTEDDDLNFIITTDIFTSDGNCGEDSQDSMPSDSRAKDSSNESSTVAANANLPKPVCKKEGNFFICLICKISENYERPTLIEHFQMDHNRKFYMCEQCHQGFERRPDLKLHTETSHIIKCDCCEQTFNNTRLYRIHKRTQHNNAKPYECTVCQKVYATKSILEEHMNTHTGVRPFKCPECSKDFASKCTLQTHMKTHKDRPRPYQCDQCEKRFLNQQNLNQHKKLHVSIKAFQCDVCNKAFITQHSLQVHKIVHSGQRPFICRICGKSFARRPEIKDHERIHTGERPFKCEYCPMAFAQRTNLATHTKSTHLNEKLHKCDICLRSFKRKRLLDYHIKAVHTGERPHKCEVCGAGFVYPEHYKKHMLIHSGRKPYACEVCGKQFHSRDNRNAHRFVHSDKKPYECMECGAGFMRKPLLLAHMKQTKHINDTIIVNQPQFTHLPQTQGSDNNLVIVNANEYNGITEESEIDIDNDLQSQDVCADSLEKIVFQPEDLLAEHVTISSITDKTNVEDEDPSISTVDDDHLIKTSLDDVKYLQFEDLDRDGHQTLTWVDISGHVKV